MFLEPNLKSSNFQEKTGWIEVITGCMFSGKTEELLRRLNRAKIAKQQVKIFKPAIDKRYSVNQVVSHDANAIFSIPINHAKEIYANLGNASVIGIDEVQFFDEEIVKIVVDLANKGKRIIVSGLDLDFKGEPFEPMPALMAVAEFVTKLHAICMQCGDVASFSHRLVSSERTVLLGESETYESRCRRCFYEERFDTRQKTISLKVKNSL